MGSTSPSRHPVCAPGRCAAILPQTDREKDVSILPGNRDRTLRVAHSRTPLRPALCARRPTTPKHRARNLGASVDPTNGTSLSVNSRHICTYDAFSGPFVNFIDILNFLNYRNTLQF